tara:strand:+ start:210 stop:1004 length:795 start_codon:yes stop_codon:yes gene_type:complete
MLPSYLNIFFKTLASIIFAVYGLLFNNITTLLVATILAPTSEAYYSIINSFIYTKKISVISLLIYTLIGIGLPIVLSLILGYLFSFIKDKDEKKLIPFENEKNDADKAFETANIIYIGATGTEAGTEEHDFIKAGSVKNEAHEAYDNEAKKLVSYNIPSDYMKERLVYHPINIFFSILLPFIVCFFLHYSIENNDVGLIIGISIALSFVVPLVDIGLYMGYKIFKKNDKFKMKDYIIPVVTFISNFMAVVIVSFITIGLKKNRK